jgi:hypothetical protein
LGSNEPFQIFDSDASKRPRLYIEYINPPPVQWLNDSDSVFLNETVASLPVEVETLKANQIFEQGIALASKYLQLSGGTLTGALISQAIRPSSNNLYDLGTSSFRWATIWTNNLNAQGNVQGATGNFSGNLSANNFNGNVSCTRIIGGSDTNYCVDTSGSTVTTTYCSAISCSVSVQSGDQVSIWAKGSLTGTNSAQTVSLNVGNSTVDTVGMKQANSADKVPFSLVYLHASGSTGTINITVGTTGGTLNDVDIMAQVKR